MVTPDTPPRIMGGELTVTINWGVFLTAEFLIGVVVVGLLLNVLGTYVVRSIDWIARVLPAFFRRAQENESARIQRLADAATADHAIYAALAAEASRLRSHQLRQFFFSFVCLSTMFFVLILLEREGQPPRVVGLLLTIFLLVMGFFQFSRGLDSGTHAQRLDTALRQVQRNLKLPVMD